MKHNKDIQQLEPTDVELLIMIRKEWEAKRDALANCFHSWHYFNGGVTALDQVIRDLGLGDKNE
ncbi:MAG: hypothetical protein GY748_19245 [Planctomycetaceae bacterium]|nr:hypothetical protein [Planctomycetaceae bacterium]